jgi:signal peptidase I
VDGESMLETLQDQDRVLVSDLFYTPERGDIVVFEDYSTSLRKAVIKRVIGLPGETVEVRLNESGDVVVFINGELLTEEYTYNAKDCYLDPKAFNKPITVGENEIYVMGDNRYHSTDSRYESVGPINIDAILGKVIIRFFPVDKFGTVE